jgi:glycosyltransferase involved in cell wall biosynthesis
MTPRDITVLLLTYNEAPNLRRTLARLSWASDVLIVDSFSSDATLEIARSFPNVRVVQRAFDTFAGQCNFGLARITSEWVLSLDADYVLSYDLIGELHRPLRDALYPPRTVLYRRRKACYRDEGHAHRVQIDGRVGRLNGVIFHDDRKPFTRWLSEQRKYMVREASHLRHARARDLKLQDRVRRWVVVAPPLVFAHTLLVKGLIFDGWRGWVYVGQRTLAELLLAYRLAAARLHHHE